MFSQLKLAWRMALVIGLGVLAALVMALLGLRGISAANERMQALETGVMTPMNDLRLINDRMQAQLLTMAEQLGTGDGSTLSAASAAAASDELEESVTAINDAWKKFMASVHLSSEESTVAANYDSARLQFVSEGLRPAISALLLNDREGLQQAYDDAKRLGGVADRYLSELIDGGYGRVAAESEASESSYETLRLAFLFTLLALSVVLAFLGWLVIRSVTRPLGEAIATFAQIAEGRYDNTIVARGKDEIAALMRALDRMQAQLGNVVGDMINTVSALAGGDLTRTIEANYPGSFGQLKTDMNATIEKLTTVVQEIQDASFAVKSGSYEISSGNQNLSQRTEEQAASLEETSSAMEQMTATVRQSADNARQANTLARSARDTAETGGRVVGNAVEAMSEINASSKKIADIIGVIDEIAFQTNLLALNASVEAARAGDQGRGFAVVASEVRNLAGRSATAAREIKDLIKDSVGKVEEGSKLVNQSGEVLAEIVTAVKKVTDIIEEIAVGSSEQAAGIDEVSKAVTQMDEMTQQNAALVEESAAASVSLGEQAEGLERLIGFFKINGDGARSLEAPRKRAPVHALQVSKPAASAPVKRLRNEKPVRETEEEWAEF